MAYDSAHRRVYKTELINRHGPWKTIDQVELATLEWSTGTTTDDYTQHATGSLQSNTSN